MMMKQAWERKGSMSVEMAIMEGLFEGATYVIKHPRLDRMLLLYDNGEIGKVLLSGADMVFVQDFIDAQRALHDRRLQLGSWVDDNQIRTSVLNVEPDGSAQTLDITIQGKRVARLWIEQNVQLLPLTGERQVEFYVEPVDGSRSSVQYEVCDDNASVLGIPHRDIIVALTLKKEDDS